MLAQPLHVYVEPARSAATAVIPTHLISRAFENKIAQDRILLLTHSSQRADLWLRLYVSHFKRQQFSPGISLNLGQKLTQDLVNSSEDRDKVLIDVERKLFPVRQFALREHLDVAVEVEIWQKQGAGYVRAFRKTLDLSQSYPIIDTSTTRSHQFLRYEEISQLSFGELVDRLASKALDDFYRTAMPP